jgi:hypothetical protein
MSDDSSESSAQHQLIACREHLVTLARLVQHSGDPDVWRVAAAALTGERGPDLLTEARARLAEARRKAAAFDEIARTIGEFGDKSDVCAQTIGEIVQRTEDAAPSAPAESARTHCPYCQGRGKYDGTKGDACDHCDGTGEVACKPAESASERIIAALDSDEPDAEEIAEATRGIDVPALAEKMRAAVAETAPARREAEASEHEHRAIRKTGSAAEGGYLFYCECGATREGGSIRWLAPPAPREPAPERKP